MYPTILSILLLTSTQTNAWSGILIDGQQGNTQLYFPTSKQHSMGNVNFGLPHCSFSAAVSLNGLAYYLGGSSCTNGTNAVYIFDPKTNTTSMGPATAATRYGPAAAVFGDGILVCGGGHQSCELFSATSQTWKIVGQMKTGITGFALAVVNNRVFLFGGQPIDGGGDACGNVATVYSFSSDWGWLTEGAMPIAVHSHTAVTLDNNNVLICGGKALINGSCSGTPKCYIYTASTDTWKAAASMSIERREHAMLMSEGNVHTFHPNIHIQDASTHWVDWTIRILC